MRSAGAAIIALAAGSIIAGLLTVGGPWQARQDRRDEMRLQDITAIGRHLKCLHGLATDPHRSGDPLVECGEEPRMEDPYTGVPYRVDTTAAAEARVCADFETAPDPPAWLVGGRGRFDPLSGCLTLPLRNPDKAEDR